MLRFQIKSLKWFILIFSILIFFTIVSTSISLLKSWASISNATSIGASLRQELSDHFHEFGFYPNEFSKIFYNAEYKIFNYYQSDFYYIVIFTEPSQRMKYIAIGLNDGTSLSYILLNSGKWIRN